MKTIRNISTTMYMAVACFALTVSSLANAANLAPGRGIYVFSGPVTITHNPSGTVYNCTLDTKTVFDIDPAVTGIEMLFVNAAVVGCGPLTPIMPWDTTAGAVPPFPGSVPQGGFIPWPGPPTALPVAVQINNMSIVTPAGPCGPANVPATWDNNAPGVASTYAFNFAAMGVCTINGVIGSVAGVPGFVAMAPDIDAFN